MKRAIFAALVVAGLVGSVSAFAGVGCDAVAQMGDSIKVWRSELAKNKEKLDRGDAGDLAPYYEKEMVKYENNIQEWEQASKECEVEKKAERAENERQAKARSAEKARQAKARAAEKERMAKPGVRIGMTAEQVLNETSWGKPKSVHRTTTASGVREQWVYGGHNYLYFDNGVLTAIQN